MISHDLHRWPEIIPVASISLSGSHALIRNRLYSRVGGPEKAGVGDLIPFLAISFHTRDLHP